ncbi:DUF3071 domain-containing protein [Corynebacterium lizhenjunii]|uniref:DUF3071 domain-containing protein n=1 Tax=Corynebacterium lizhenjunii TaxID=2709394 RepID=A0A7T0KHF4_9CORY|nr:septation protein SepH [Corynebacterium lizhenjunii]QPK79758.1 DUF3071 domain-containing protein [Corynebacterium lizhenjunii]
MRELFVVAHESTPTSLVLRTDEGEEFFVDLEALEGPVRSLLLPSAAAPTGPADSAGPAAPAAPAGTTGSADAPTEPADSPSRPLRVAGSAPARRPVSDALSMRPAEIQQRIRAGASIAELAEEMNVAHSRVEPFAHPVLMERARIAELAKQAHPVREDGPAKLTIFEVLATAFAARGHSLSEATWDAYRAKGEPWTVRVTWKAGLSENEAEWTLKQSRGSADTLEARNSVAADLTDPDFVQPVRSLTSVGRGARRVEAIDSRDDFYAADSTAAETVDEAATDAPAFHDLDSRRRDRNKAKGRDALTDLTAPTTPPASAKDSTASEVVEPASSSDASNSAASSSAASSSTAGKGAEDTESGDAEEFFQNPDPQPQPSKRRRRATTPNWEDVLLGVRGNTKRPRN